jgi:hypothetical protein
MAGTCLVCRRPFTRNVRLAGGLRWSCPHCGNLQLGPNALAKLVRDREIARLTHQLGQRDYVIACARREPFNARAQAVRNGGVIESGPREIDHSG